MKERNIFHFLWCSAGFCATWMANWGNCSIEQSLFNNVEVSSIYISEKIINGGGNVTHSYIYTLGWRRDAMDGALPLCL